MEKGLRGIVTGVEGKTSSVRLDGAEMLRCGLVASIRLVEGGARTSRVAVGDRVEVARTGPGEGVIEVVETRRTQLARGRDRREQVIAANVDQLAIVTAVRDPDWRPGFVDRMLCAAQKGGLDPLIVANKVDLLDAGRNDAARANAAVAVARDLECYRKLGYRTVETSAQTGAGLAPLRAALKDRVTVFSGQSGVGKSSLLNAIETGLTLTTREVSRGNRKGRHTTSSVSLLPLTGGGYVLDTPGVRSFAFYDLEPREVGWLFKEVAGLAPSCKYRDCLHLTEPDCAVRYAVESGVVDARRYASYQRLLASLDEEEDERG